MLTDKKNSLWLSIQFAFTLVSSLIGLKLNLSSFGNHYFGIWILLASIWGFGSTIDFGFGTAVIKYVAEFREDKEKINIILSSSFCVFIVLGLVIFALGNLLGTIIYLTDESIVPSELKQLFINVFLILGISFLIQYLALFFKSVIDGLNNFIFTSKIVILQSAVNLIGISFVFILKLNIIALSFVYLLGSSVLFISYLLYFLRESNFKISLKFFDLSEIKKILKFSLSVQVMSVFNTLIDPVIKYIIGNYYSVASVPSYEIARRFAISISGLFFNAFKIILPKASSLKNEFEQLSFIKNEVAKYCKLGTIYSGFMFGVMSFPIVLIIYWVFKSEEALLIFLMLALPESINNFGYAIYNFFLGVGRVKILVLIQLNNLIFVMASTTIGFIVFDNIFGLTGYFFSVIIANVLLVSYLDRKWVISIFDFFRQVKIYKLIFLLFLMSTVICLLYLNLMLFYSAFLLLSLISFVTFAGDIKASYTQIVKPILTGKFLNS